MRKASIGVAVDRPVGSVGIRTLETPLEAAQRLGLDRVSRNPARQVRDMARRGQLTAVRVGAFVMIDPISVDRFIEGAK